MTPGSTRWGGAAGTRFEFFVAHVPMPESFLANEIDRYMVLPGQALAYLIGKRELLRLRDDASRRLGPRFALPALPRRGARQRVPADARARGQDPEVVNRGIAAPPTKAGCEPRERFSSLPAHHFVLLSSAFVRARKGTVPAIAFAFPPAPS